MSVQQYSPRVGAAAAAALASASYPSAAEEEGELYAEDHDCISIVFIDVVGFTALAETQPAAATMRQLHALFSRFDELCGLLGCYKGAPCPVCAIFAPYSRCADAPRRAVETVGDAYMVCAGMLPRLEAHASAALLFALHAHGAAAAAGLRVRAGVSAGPVTSGLVGRLRARFCIFGGATCFDMSAPPACMLLDSLCVAQRRYRQHREPHGERRGAGSGAAHARRLAAHRPA
jgi:class 3 adenylate cyclase